MGDNGEPTTLIVVSGAAETSDLPVDRFRAVYEATYAPLHAYCRRRTAAAADADDVVAEVFSVAWRRLDELPPGDAALPWLYGVAWRVLANQRRSSRRRAALATRLEGAAAVASADSDSGDAAPVREALAHLSPRHQEILRLHCWEDLGHAEIAAVLGVSVNAATVRLHRARKALGRELERKVPSARHKHFDETTEAQ